LAANLVSLKALKMAYLKAAKMAYLMAPKMHELVVRMVLRMASHLGHWTVVSMASNLALQ